MSVFGYMVVAATDRAHRDRLVLSTVAYILTKRYRAMWLYGGLYVAYHAQALYFIHQDVRCIT